jgi:hypothetical protein
VVQDILGHFGYLGYYLKPRGHTKPTTTNIFTFLRHALLRSWFQFEFPIISVFSALDRNEYNHITATYFLLAERKLRAQRQEQAQSRKPELKLPVLGNALSR